MPISKKVLMKCENCGFKTYRFIGDVLPDENFMKPCPKCKKSFSMEIVKTADESNIVDTIVGSIGKIIDMMSRK